MLLGHWLMWTDYSWYLKTAKQGDEMKRLCQDLLRNNSWCSSLISVSVGQPLSCNRRKKKKSLITIFFPFIPWRLMKMYLCIDVNEKCKLGNFFLVHCNTKAFQKLFLNKWDFICSSFSQGGKPSFLESFSCVFIPQTEVSFYILKEVKC